MLSLVLRRRLARTKLLAVALILSGCFEIRERDTDGTPIVWPVVRKLDNFDTAWPNWLLLQSWGCAAWPAELAQSVDCGRAENGQFLSFDLTAPSKDEATGAELGTYAVGELDLSPYDELVFRLKLDEVEADPLPDDFEVRVMLHCKGAASAGVSPSGENLGLVSAIASPPADGTWRLFALRLADFIQPPWQEGTEETGYNWVSIDTSRCLTMIDSIGFQPATTAQHMAGTIWLDDLELDDFEVELGELASAMRFSPFWCESSPEGDERLACDTTQHAPEMTFRPLPKASLCTRPERVNDLLEIIGDQRDFAGFERFSFAASFAPSAGSLQSGTLFTARLWCGGLSPGSSPPPSLVRDVLIAPGASTYTLPLTSFERAEYPLVRVDRAACLKEVDKVCFEAQLDDGEGISGTLRVDDLVLK